MRLFSSDQFGLPLPEGHRFPAEKYILLRQRVEENGLVGPGELEVPEPASFEQLSIAHLPAYIESVFLGTLSEKEIRRIGFPWTPELVERSRRSVGGTIAACRMATHAGVGANMAGGTHHAYADHGEGYCVFNDCAVAARLMQAENLAQRVLIVDCDVHQGNGTAAIFAGDSSVFTFSIHAEKNFPFHKEPSDLDIALPDETGDEAYLQALEGGIAEAVERAKADLVIYLAGADPYMGDSLGRLSLTKGGLGERDRLVFHACKQAGLPVGITLAGGYASDIRDSVDIHYQTLNLAKEIFV